MSNSETGHVNNIQALKTLIDTVSTFGAEYNPGNPLLQVGTMTSQWTNCVAMHNAFEQAEQSARNPINHRQQLFDETYKLLTRVMNFMKSCGASKEIVADVKGLADRYRGYGVKVKRLADGSKDPNHVSNSHQGFVQRADTFRQVVTLLDSEPAYSPNEAALKISFLNTRADELATANNDMSALLAPVSASKILRDKSIYEKEIGLVDVGQAAKAYVVAVFGPNSPEAKLVKAIKFTRRKI